MTTSTLTVTDFVLARLAEDEAAARNVLSDYAQHRPNWESPITGVVILGDPDLDGMLPTGDGPLARHIARHDPARVLAQCAAMRKIVEAVDSAVIEFWMAQDLGMAGPLLETWQIRTLCSLASIWSDHPQFNPTWS